ncbi:hypothetical protein [Kribbella sp. NPDC006257]|uniref:hypothetical protein n=1 Tax=Kribbella sp. NPDC006257 TaxID=3156738 RepID=UPI0033B3BE39
MKTRLAVSVLSAAAALGTLVGAFVLPDRGGHDGGGKPGPTPTTLKTTPRPSSPHTSSAPDGGPVVAANMLTDADFRKVGLTVTQRPPDVRLELVGCDNMETLDNVAVSGPPVQRAWEAEKIVAYQQVIAAKSEEEAAESYTKVLRKLEACQKKEPGHWVYGPTHQENLDPVTTVSWLGSVDGSLNTTGKAPSGEKIDGGIAVMRRGIHVGVFEINFCASAGDEPACVVAGGNASQQLAGLSRTAAGRLD